MSKDQFKARPVTTSKPTAARLYDYYLGGNAHYTVDTVFAERMFKINPYMDSAVHHNREFLQRAVRFMAAECGIRQFLDIGSGIPTVGNTHHVADEVAYGTRVVYVDKDEEAVNQSWTLLEDENATNAVTIEGDLREPDSILEHPDTQRLLDFNEPVGLLIIAVWQFISNNDRPYELMARYRDRLAPGSYVAMTHGSTDELSDEIKEMADTIVKEYDDTADPVTTRSREQFTAFFDGWNLVDPGIVYATDWRPINVVDPNDPVRPSWLAGVARKP